VTDGQTDGQNYDSQDRASIAASRGKNDTDPLCHHAKFGEARTSCRAGRRKNFVLSVLSVTLSNGKNKSTRSPLSCLNSLRCWYRLSLLVAANAKNLLACSLDPGTKIV